MYFGQVREASVPGRGWLQISDADVEEVGEEALLDARAAVFMVFYERVGEYEAPPRERMIEKEYEGDETSQASKMLDDNEIR